LIVKANGYFSGLTEQQENRFKVKRYVGMSRKRLQAASIGDTRATQNNPQQTYNQDKALRYLKWSLEDIGEFVPNSDNTDVFQQMYLSDEAKSAVEEIKRWYSSREWYRERNISWRRGWLLYGEPGTGKTMLAKSVAQHLKIPIYVFDIASLSNQEMYEYWKELQENTPCVALIEDIDAVFHGRKNLIKDSELTFDCLLNCIGGVESSNGVITIITTNHIDKVDPAIGVEGEGEPSRPGRIDRVVFLGKTDRVGRIAIASHILKGYDSLIERIVDEYPDVTGAQFENICVKLALQEFWKGEAS
jgi:SpoVK/Ycf46/Vps4 family AAA+-type ATPase